MSQRMAHFRQNAGHVVRLGAAIFLTGTFLLTSGISTVAYSQDRKTKKGGDTVLLMQTGVFKQIEQAKTNTTQTMKTTPKLVIPDVKTLEHYAPPPLIMSMFISRDPTVELFRLPWLRMEDNYPPFGLPKKVFNSYSRKDRKEIEHSWETAKIELRVAFLSDKKGVSPENALKMHTPDEVKKLLDEWQGYKEIDKLKDELMRQRQIPVRDGGKR